MPQTPHNTMKEPPYNPTPIPTVDPKGYSLSGRIMLSVIVLLFFLVLIMISLHLYARWYLRRARRRQLRRNLRRRRTNIVFLIDSSAASYHTSAESRGLDAALLASLPVFVYDPESSPDNPPECAVCLSEFESGETGRILPKCNHGFHTDCIDMWFHSHDTCPLCRAPVEPQPQPETRPEVVVTVCEPDIGSSSGLRAAEEESRIGNEAGTERRKQSLVAIEIPASSDASGFESPSSFRSPMSRMLSFRRMLSRERKGSMSPSSGGGGGGCSSAADLSDAERGGKDETR